jgi:hypothetical protein
MPQNSFILAVAVALSAATPQVANSFVQTLHAMSRSFFISATFTGFPFQSLTCFAIRKPPNRSKIPFADISS